MVSGGACEEAIPGRSVRSRSGTDFIEDPLMLDIFDLVMDAFSGAKAKDDIGYLDREIHRNRSQNFVDVLALGFQRYDRSRNPKVHVFWSRNLAHRSDFNRKEFLYDITVCEVDKTRSATRRALLSYVTETYWIVESEFERNSRAAIIDMSKLVLGQSENALFIGPSVGPKEGFLEMLASVAKGCAGQTHLAVIDHPSKWKTGPRNPELYLWSRDEWLLDGRSVA